MNWAHLHLALNHLPVLGVPFVAVIFLIALRRRDVAWQRLALCGFVTLFFVALAAKFTGDFAHELVVDWNGFDHDLMHVHEESADQAVTAIFLLGLFSGIGLFLSRAGRALPKWAVAVVLVLALASTALLLRTASRGGEIRHPEIRPGFQPPSAEQS
ncbi:MAG: hypothetical protein EXS22_04885 [Pedosphaera sp.]|nr:hypothetical protein [Pedosphaera sp.]MSU43361.1 hypothetical protein [Pedosphaera sp.]